MDLRRRIRLAGAFDNLNKLIRIFEELIKHFNEIVGSFDRFRDERRLNVCRQTFLVRCQAFLVL